MARGYQLKNDDESITIPSLKITTGIGAGKVLTSDIDGNITLQTPAAGSAEKQFGGQVIKDTANTFFTYLGEIIVEKGTTHTYLITTFVNAGTGTLKLYNFTTAADILSISVINTLKEIKSGTIDLATLVAGNNVIELWGKNTAGTIDVSSFQIKVV